MANFTPKSIVKSAVRTLTNPIATLANFTEVVDDIITNNPFACTPYESGGVAMPAVEKTREAYTARFAYEDNESATIGTVSAKANSTAGYNAAIAAVAADAALTTAIGGTAVHNTDEDTWSATLKCHAANGELYNVAVTRTAVTVSGYTADSILTAVENWADAIPYLA